MPADERPGEAEERRVGRLRSRRDHGLPHARADEQPGGEAGQRRGADHEALEVARGRRRERQRDNDPVESGHRGVAQATLRQRLGNAAEVSRGARTGRTISAANGPAGPSAPPAGAALAHALAAAPRSPCWRCAASPSSSGSSSAPATQPAGQAHVERFAAAWERGDYAAMYSELTAGRSRPRAPRALHRRLPGRAAAPRRRRRSTRPSRARTAAPTACRCASPRARSAPSRARSCCPPRGDGDRLVARARLPRAAAGERLRRVTRMPDARHAAGPRPHACWPRATTAPRRSLLAPQVVGQLGPIPPERREELAALGVPADAEVGVSGLERIFDERLLGDAGRRARRRRTRAQAHEPAPGPGGAHDDLAAGRAGGGHRARRAPGRRRGAPAAHRRGARLRGDRLLGPAAARVDVQDDHDDGRARGGDHQPAEDLSRAAEGRAGGRRPRERQRRVLRRHARRLLRQVVQLGLRPARRRSSAPSASSPPPSATASTRRRTSPARPRARSRPPARSATTWRSARRPSARAACRRRRCRWRRSRRPSACAGAGRT